MTPRKRLARLSKTGCKKIAKLQEKIIFSLSLTPKEREPIIAYVVIESLNTWNNFLRALYLSLTVETKSAKRKKITISPAIPDFNTAIGIAINSNSIRPMLPPASGVWPRRSEPKWHDLNNFRRSCQAINCSYMVDIETALSIGTRAYDDLPTMRNYYAHRNEATGIKVRNLAQHYGISSSFSPTEILCSLPLNAGRPLILDILDDLYLSIEFLCEGL